MLLSLSLGKLWFKRQGGPPQLCSLPGLSAEVHREEAVISLQYVGVAIADGMSWLKLLMGLVSLSDLSQMPTLKKPVFSLDTSVFLGLLCADSSQCSGFCNTCCITTSPLSSALLFSRQHQLGCICSSSSVE